MRRHGPNPELVAAADVLQYYVRLLDEEREFRRMLQRRLVELRADDLVELCEHQERKSQQASLQDLVERAR